MPRIEDRWRHVDNVDTKTFKEWTEKRMDDLYLLDRPHDLIERARVVQLGDQLTLVNSQLRNHPKALFDITFVSPVDPDESTESRFFGKRFLVRLERSTD